MPKEGALGLLGFETTTLFLRELLDRLQVGGGGGLVPGKML